MNRDLENLVSLQKNLSRQREIENLMGEVPPHLKEIDDTFSRLSDERDRFTRTLEESRAEQRESERDLEALRDEKQKFREQLMLVTNQREYAAVLKEIDAIDEKIRIGEETVLEIMERIETAERGLADGEEEFQRISAEHRENMAEWESDKRGLAEDLENLKHEQKVIEQDMPEDLRRTFWRIYEARNGTAVVPIQDRACGGCHVQLRPQQYAEVRGGKVIATCVCMRFLYYDE